jgi:phytoene dehydrogenase-like protein
MDGQRDVAPATAPRQGAVGRSDVLIVGAGHNGLVCAFYLARAGLKVTVLERRGVVGGAAVTEEFHPGFRNSVASYVVSLLNETVIADMGLLGHGLRLVERPAGAFLPLEDGRYLMSGNEGFADEVAKFSRRDAERLEAYHAHLDLLADFLRSVELQTPPNVTGDGWMAALPEMLKAAGLGRRVTRYSLAERQALLDIFTKSAGDFLDSWFESDPLKGMLGYDGIVGSFVSPYASGTAYVLLHHVFGQLNGKKGVWGHAIGGMGAITQAMRRACEAEGVRILTDAAVSEVIAETGRAVGVATEDGRVFRARAVVSNLNPRLLFGRMVDPALLPAHFRQRMETWRCHSGAFRMNVALSELPSFTCLPGREPAAHHGTSIIIAPSLGYLDRAYHDAREHGWSRRPVIEMFISSTLDDTLAPPGQHVASLFCHHASYDLPEGRHWDDCREEVADLMISTIDAYAPGFRASVIGRQVLSPLDLERTFGLVRGDIFHGALGLDQLFSARPALGYANYRTPVRGLYLCGSGTHPGGGVSGAPGHNAAREILSDFRRRRL